MGMTTNLPICKWRTSLLELLLVSQTQLQSCTHNARVQGHCGPCLQIDLTRTEQENDVTVAHLQIRNTLITSEMLWLS